MLTLAIIVCGAVVALSFRPEARPVLDVVILWLSDFWDLFGPGGKLHPASFIEHSGHLVVEGALLVVISVLLLQTSFKPKSRDKAELTEKVRAGTDAFDSGGRRSMPTLDCHCRTGSQEVQELCDEWQPEPLHGPLTKFQQLLQVPVISRSAHARRPPRFAPRRPRSCIALMKCRPSTRSDTGPYVVANGKRVLNCVSFNFLGAAGNAEVRRAAISVARQAARTCHIRGHPAGVAALHRPGMHKSAAGQRQVPLDN